MAHKHVNEELPTTSGVLVLSTVIAQYINDLKKGQQKGYDSVVQALIDPDLKPLHLRRYLRSLRNCATSLTKEAETLVGAVLAVKWASEDDETVTEFVEFLSTLLSAHTYYLGACLRMLVKLLLPNIKKDIGDINMEAQTKVFANVHEALQKVLELVPTAPRFLLPVLGDFFPYIKKATIYQECYIKNLFQVAEYLPSKRHQILELILDELTKIDVAIPEHELNGELEGEVEDEDEITQFDLDIDAPKTVEVKPTQCVANETADKLDQLLVIFFDRLHEECFRNGVFSADSSSDLFDDLLVTFVNSFLDLCWTKIDDPSTSAILRQSAAAYMSSLVARHKSIGASTVQTCLDLMIHWIHGFIDAHDANCSGPNVNKYGPFYSVCQAVFYIFVFRNKQLLELEDGLEYMRKANFERVVTSRLNPLKVCLPTIVEKFAVITRNHEIVFCYTIMERNKRTTIPVASSTSQKAVSKLTSVNMLDSFFPFDPYFLRRSSKFIKPFYREWEGVDAEEEYDDAEGSDVEEEEGEDYHQYGKSLDAEAPGFTPETPMAVSPGFWCSPQHPPIMPTWKAK